MTELGGRPQDSRLPTLQAGRNLIANPGAEHGLTGWTTVEGAAAVIVYGSSGYPALTSPGPVDRGSRFFCGGTVARSRIQQTITLPGVSGIDLGTTSFDVEAWLGGRKGQHDTAQFTMAFRAGGGQALSTILLGPVTASQRHMVTGLFLCAAAGMVPVGSRQVVVELLFVRGEGSANDGYADSVSLILTPGRAA